MLPLLSSPATVIETKVLTDRAAVLCARLGTLAEATFQPKIPFHTCPTTYPSPSGRPTIPGREVA
jgi:hypothetical protein